MASPTLNLSPEQLACLASPVRAEIVRMLSAEGEMSIKELAAVLGRSTTRLYHHIQQLLSTGLIRVASTRQAGARSEAVYQLVSQRLSSEQAVRAKESRAALATIARRFLATAARRFAQAAANVEIVAEGPERALSIRQIQIKADDGRLRALNERLDELIEEFAARTGDGRSITVTLVVTPGS